MLLNIVRSRYQEMPVFLEVGSVVAQYSYLSSASVGYFREFINNSIAPTSDTASVDANVAFSEFPTITYVPLAGEAFAKHLYSEVPAAIFFSAAHAGWAVDVLMQIGLHRIGAAENMSFREYSLKKQRESDLEKLQHFARAIELLSILSDEEVIEFQQVISSEGTDKKTGTEPKQYLVIAEEVPEHLQPMLAEFRQIIGITKSKRFLVTVRTADIADDEISIQSRSVMAMIKFLGKGVEIPVEHFEGGWVVDYGLQTVEDVEELFPFRMRSSRERPENAFSAVRYRGYWYYINNDDIISKRALEHIMILFQLKAPQSKVSTPLLTIPTR